MKPETKRIYLKDCLPLTEKEIKALRYLMENHNKNKLVLVHEQSLNVVKWQKRRVQYGMTYDDTHTLYCGASEINKRAIFVEYLINLSKKLNITLVRKMYRVMAMNKTFEV